MVYIYLIHHRPLLLDRHSRHVRCGRCLALLTSDDPVAAAAVVVILVNVIWVDTT